MARFLKVLIAVGILYFAVTKGGPWLKSQLAELRGSHYGNSYQAICVAAADRAVDEFTKRLRPFSTPPIDVDAWADSMSKSREQVEIASRDCRNCDHEACLEATKALANLGSMATWFDDSVNAGRGIPPDGASRLDGVYEALNRARSLL